MIHFSTFTSQTDNNPVPATTTWEGLCEMLSQHRVGGKYGPGWSPTIYAEGSKRNKGGVTGITALVFDLDHLTIADCLGMVERVEAESLAYALHSTFSHGDGNCSLRLVIPVSRVIRPAEFDRVRGAVTQHFKLPADKSTNDLCRLFFLPTCPPGGTPVFKSSPGKVLDVDAWLQPKVDAPSPVAAPMDLAGLRAALGGRGRPTKKAPWIPALLKGEALASEGGRDNTLQQVCSYLTHKFGETPLEQLLYLITPSVIQMAGEEGPDYWLAVAEDKLERARADYDRSNAEGERVAAEMGARVRLESSGGVSSDYYTDEEVARWANEAGCSVEEMQRRWVIQYRSNYFFLKNGAYTEPLPREAAENDVHSTLSRAANHISLTTTTQAGAERRRKLGEIVQDHGRVAHKLSYSYLLKSSHYDPEDSSINLAAAPMRNIVPKENPEIHRWLDLMGGVERERLFDWLATFTQLSKPTSALYLRGPRGVGKNMFYLGLSRLWTTRGPTMLRAEHFTKYNDEFLRCPLLVVDEAMPGAENANKLDAYMRQLVTSETRPLLRKFLDGGTLEGAVRVILAANKDDLLHFSDDMNADAKAATAERYFYLRINEKPGEYLASLGGREYTEPWVAEDGIAAHVLWLAQTRKVRPYGRLLVSGQLKGVGDKIAASSGIAPHIHSFIISVLKDDRLRGQLLRAGEGEVWIESSTICDKSRWETLVHGVRCPNSVQVVKGLKAVSKSEETVRAYNLRGKRCSYFRVDVSMLCEAAESQGTADTEEILSYTRAKDAVIRRYLDNTTDVISLTG